MNIKEITNMGREVFAHIDNLTENSAGTIDDMTYSIAGSYELDCCVSLYCPGDYKYEGTLMITHKGTHYTYNIEGDELTYETQRPAK